MNHYLIRDAQDSPQAVTAETLDEALTKLGLDANDISRAEVMITGALPPANWRDVTPPKHKKLTPEQKIRTEVLKAVEGLFVSGCQADCYCIDHAKWADFKSKQLEMVFVNLTESYKKQPVRRFDTDVVENTQGPEGTPLL
jgi:hypothetical protein